ncbi:MAG: hypothetical protein CVV03_05560 [Firmicutes bacterium HGW-Firmicutes-8]|nr:MAG: hypothetical protein CVV03_05560 [Firmicutes bacterium HGW-Firmicutes-8]
MLDVIWEPLIDTVKMIPLLLLIYIGIEFIEYKFGSKVRAKVKNAGKAGPVLGAAFGSIPQCGFSVISTALYTQKLITMGTLMAVYISTSDEAVPIILAHPQKAGIIIPLITVKVIIALLAGYSIDYLFHRTGRSVTESEIAASRDESGQEQHNLIKDAGCCGHDLALEKPDYKVMIIHPVIHTFKVAVFIFAASVMISLVFKTGGETLGSLFGRHSALQPIVTALVGLIPNCAASVGITQVFLKGGISFGSAVAGLSASAGLGMLVLFKENRNLKDTLRIIGILYGISVTAGLAIQYFYG